MIPATMIDGMLVHWGERLFYPHNRVVKAAPLPHLAKAGQSQRVAHMRQRIEATVLRRAPQVMVKVTGGGRGMAAIAAHLRYIAKAGRLPFEDDRGVTREGKDALHDLVEQWRYGGSEIDQISSRREAFNIMLSMPAGTDSQNVLRAAREFAQAELAGHRYVLVLHEHQSNPHVHLSVRVESRQGQRLNPRKTDLHRWRETFAEKLRGWGVDAEASRQTTRGAHRNNAALWRVKAASDGRLNQVPVENKTGANFQQSRLWAIQAWIEIAKALNASDHPGDKALAQAVVHYVRSMPVAIYKQREREQLFGGRERMPKAAQQQQVEFTRTIVGRDVER